MTESLMRYLEESPTPYHGVALSESILENRGAIKLDERESWNLEEGKTYYISRNGSSLFAFTIPQTIDFNQGFRFITSHTDSPTFKLKNGTLLQKEGYLLAEVEVLGGPIFSSWLDRNLSLAGRYFVKEGGKVISKLYKKPFPSVLIPNAAIHMNREINNGFEYNPQKHLSIILAEGKFEKGLTLGGFIEKDLNLPKGSILDIDLLCFDDQKPSLTGWNGEFFSSGRIDNLAMCHASIEALGRVKQPKGIPFIALFDNEEIGSKTPHGADSAFLGQVTERIILNLRGSREDYLRSLASSFMISADGAHGIHPNYIDHHDSAFKPRLNGGPVIKRNANWNYASSAETGAIFQLLCEKAKVPYQVYINRSDRRTGKTLGPIAASLLGVRAVDVGNAMWSMHSVRETAGTKDQAYMVDVLYTHLEAGDL